MKPSDYIKKGWCQGASAKDDQGIVVHPNSVHARSWCLTGALIAAYAGAIEHREKAVQRLSKALPGVILPRWNDMPIRRKDEVLNLLESVGE